VRTKGFLFRKCRLTPLKDLLGPSVGPWGYPVRWTNGPDPSFCLRCCVLQASIKLDLKEPWCYRVDWLVWLRVGSSYAHCNESGFMKGGEVLYEHSNSWSLKKGPILQRPFVSMVSISSASDSVAWVDMSYRQRSSCLYWHAIQTAIQLPVLRCLIFAQCSRLLLKTNNRKWSRVRYP
jgi:hypothetical protein